MEQQTCFKSKAKPSRFQGLTQQPGIEPAASNGLPLGLLPFLVSWWKGVYGLEVLGGLAMLFLMGFWVHWVFYKGFPFAKLFASSEDRVDDVRIEETIFWWAWGIGILSWISVYVIDANTVATLAANAVLAYFGKFGVNKSYAQSRAREVDYDDYDE